MKSVNDQSKIDINLALLNNPEVSAIFKEMEMAIIILMK